tara:strand:- start:1429 stop:2031 length:603 start_codon:yes stop_codon:yes gene_type:complete
MSRSKKSRKPGVGSSGPVKETTKTPKVPVEKRAKKLKGKPSGNRQNEAKPIADAQNSQVNKDSRIGNKTPIALGTLSNKKTVKPKKVNPSKPLASSVAAIRTIEPEQSIDIESLMQELEAIEQDERLLTILTKQDDEIELSESDVNFFNAQMDKHQSIRETLGLDDEDDEDDEESDLKQSASSEDDLWDKFNNSDLSKFE